MSPFDVVALKVVAPLVLVPAGAGREALPHGRDLEVVRRCAR